MSSAGLASTGAATLAAQPSSLASSPSTSDGSLPVVGACWRGKYHVLEQFADAAGAAMWRGRAVEGDHDVVLRATRPAEPDIRAQAWAKLGGIDSPALQHPRDALRAGEWRVEVADAPRGVPLHVWRAEHPNVDLRVIRMVVNQLADALAALHAFELIHLNLRPEAIFVEERGLDLQCTIAGLDALTTFDRQEPLPAAVDPFYAPPEALGLNVHVSGPGICAWDWWSLGRVLQEFILGRHIVGQLANAEVRPPTPELRARAETLLLEAEKTGPRAGAVESMPGLDPQLALLLRGLLTSAKEARWTGDNIDRWVRGLPVKEHYSTPRAETHFRWRGRPCTVPEIAGILQSAEHWAENGVQLYEATTPGTLAHFLRWSPSQATAYEQLTSALELADALPLKLSSQIAQREAVTMVALLQLSTTKLVWRGRPFESATIGAMLSELGEADGLMVLRALSTRSTAMQIERIDAAAGHLLTELGRTTSEAEGILRRHGSQVANDVSGSARLFKLALEPGPALRAARDALAQGYAGSDHPAIDKLFKAQNPGRAEQVALAWIAGAPERFKFFTHTEAARRRAETLRAHGIELTTALAWGEFERALGVGMLVFGGWGLMAAWVALGALAFVLWPGPLGAGFALVPFLLAFGLRLLFSSRHARALHEAVPGSTWSWRDGPARCRRELRLAGHGHTRDALQADLANVTRELGTLTNLQPPPAPLPALPKFASVRFAGLLSWALLVACLGVGGWRAWAHPVSMKDVKAAWAPKSAQPKADAKASVKAAAAKASADEDGDIKISWPFKPGDSPVKVGVRVAQEANSAQTSYATKHGRELVAPYRPESISTLVIMPVPGAPDDVTVMIFDGKRGELLSEQVYVLEFRPIPRTWIEVNGRRGIFLDQ